MTRTRLIGWSAFGVCLLGYGVALAMFFLQRAGEVELSTALLIGGPAAVLGEIGLWVAAGCLGWTLFKGRKALFDRLFRRGAKPV